MFKKIVPLTRFPRLRKNICIYNEASRFKADEPERELREPSQGSQLNEKLLKNTHFVDTREIIKILPSCQLWEDFFEKFPVIVSSKSVDRMFGYVIGKLNSEIKIGSSSLTEEQWIQLIDASVFADIEIESMGVPLPLSERKPCSKDAIVTLILLERYFSLHQFESVADMPHAILNAALKVFSTLQLVAPVRTVFTKYIQKYCAANFDCTPVSLGLHFLADFTQRAPEPQEMSAQFCVQAITALVDCCECLMKAQASAKTECTEEDIDRATLILSTISKWCAYFALKPFESPQEAFPSTMSDAYTFHRAILEETIAQRVIETLFQFLEENESAPVSEETSENAENEIDEQSESKKAKGRRVSRVEHLLRICGACRHNRTLEMFHTHGDLRTLSHFEGAIIYHLLAQLQCDLSDQSVSSCRTAAAEVLRQATLEHAEKKFSAEKCDIDAHFQLLHRAVICALCQPYFHKYITKDQPAEEICKRFATDDWNSPKEDTAKAYQIFLIHRNYGYVPERITMNALIRAMSGHGNATVYSIIDVTVQSHRGTQQNAAKVRRKTKPLDYYTIEYIMKTCHTVKDVHRARNMYWIMCEQFPGLQHRMTQKTKEYLTDLGVANFFPRHIFSPDKDGECSVGDIPKARTLQ